MTKSKPIRFERLIFLCIAMSIPQACRAQDLASMVGIEQAPAIVAARNRWVALFQEKGIQYPPSELGILAFKQTKSLELRVSTDNGWVLLKTYPVLKASGNLGPKLREGDKQVPEGIYKIKNFNPQSRFYLSLKLDFPNEFDLEKAELEKRTEPGSNIYIHGKEESTGCLAMGDPAMDEIYAIATDVGRENITVVIAPNDMRKNAAATDLKKVPEWTKDLYQDIQKTLVEFSKYTEPPKKMTVNEMKSTTTTNAMQTNSIGTER